MPAPLARLISKMSKKESPSKYPIKTGIIQGRLTDSERLDFFPADNWENEFAAAKDIGFDSIEWGLATENWITNPILVDGGIPKINALGRQNGIAVLSVCGYFFVDFGFFLNDEIIQSAKVLHRLLEQGAKIGVKRIVIPFLGKQEIKNEEQIG